MENHELLAWMILWGVLLDKLDGTTARLLNASSEVGAQLDSLLILYPLVLLLHSFGIHIYKFPVVHHGFLMTVCGVFVVAVAFVWPDLTFQNLPVVKTISMEFQQH